MERAKSSYIDGAIENIESIVKNRKLKLKRKKHKNSVLKKKTQLKQKNILRKARRKAHTQRADMLRKQSQEIRDNFL